MRPVRLKILQINLFLLAALSAKSHITITDGSKLSADKATDILTQSKIFLEGSASFVVRNGSTSSIDLTTSSFDDTESLRNRVLLLEQTVEKISFDTMSEHIVDGDGIAILQENLRLLQLKLEAQQDQIGLIATNGSSDDTALLGDEALRLETRLAIVEARVNTLQRQLDRLIRLQLSNSREFDDVH